MQVAASEKDTEAPSFCNSKGWDQLSWVKGATKIDCGIIMEDPGMLEVQFSHRKLKLPIYRPVPLCDGDRELHITEGDRIMVGLDGASPNGADLRLRRAGYGIFFAEGHAQNVSRAVQSDWQTA